MTKGNPLLLKDFLDIRYYKYMTSIPKGVYIDKLDDIVNTIIRIVPQSK